MTYELDPDGHADSRPDLRDDLLCLKTVLAKLDINNQNIPLHGDLDMDLTIPVEVLQSLVLEVESLWRDLIASEEALTLSLAERRFKSSSWCGGEVLPPITQSDENDTLSDEEKKWLVQYDCGRSSYHDSAAAALEASVNHRCR